MMTKAQVKALAEAIAKLRDSADEAQAKEFAKLLESLREAGYRKS